MDNAIIAAYVVGAITYGALVYLFMKLRAIEKKLDSFPTPEELAKEIIRVKLPFSELPPDMQAEIMSLQSKNPKSPLSKINDKEQSSYIG
jgi:hypothetical protein